MILWRNAARFRKSRGLTLTEMAIVLGAMGLVMAAIWAVAGAVWSNSQSERLNHQIITVVQNARDYYANMGKITQPAATTACVDNSEITNVLDDDDRRLIPIEMRVDPDSEAQGLRHVFGGEFRVWCKRSGQAFQIQLSGLRQEACLRLLMQFPVLTPEVGVERVVASGLNTAINLLDIQNPGTRFPMNVSNASSSCPNGTNNEVRFDFKLRN